MLYITILCTVYLLVLIILFLPQTNSIENSYTHGLLTQKEKLMP